MHWRTGGSIKIPIGAGTGKKGCLILLSGATAKKQESLEWFVVPKILTTWVDGMEFKPSRRNDTGRKKTNECSNDVNSVFATL